MKATVMIIVLFFLLFFSTATNAQNTWIDSVKNVAVHQQENKNKIWTLVTLCNNYAFSYPDTAFVYGQQAYALSEKLNFDSGRLFSLISINGALYALGNYTLELDYALKLLPLAKRMNNIYATGFSSGAVGDCYQNLGEYATALPYYKKVLALGEKNKLPELHRMYSMLVPVFIGMQQYDSAMWYAQKGYALFKTSSYYNSNDWDMQWSQSCVYITLAQAYAGKGINDSAFKFYRLSIPVSENVNMKLSWIDGCYGMANLFKQQHNFDSAKWYAKKILLQKNLLINPVGRQKAASILADIYEEEHANDSALKYMHIAIQLKDSLYNHEKMMAFQNVLFKENEKEHAIETATTALQNRYRLYFIIAGLMVVFVVSFIMIKNKRQKQLQNMRNSIADDLHDDIGSALSSINIMSELAKQKAPEASTLLTSIGESTTAMQENMSDIVWAVNPQNDVFENVLQRMNLFASEILEAKNIELEFVTDASLSTYKFTMKQRKNLYLFFKEAINNAAKYSDAKKISVRIFKKDNHIEMNIADNGKGFNTSGIFNGNGMNTFKKRAEEINGNFNITSHINEGTTAQLKFKIT